jgi:selenide,water dikinase
VLSDALGRFPPAGDPDLLVGFETCDDAAVYRLSDEAAVISSVDFITPPVDDPYWFGQIAAANSLSDVYAMGGRPLMALNLVMFPRDLLGTVHLGEILRGGYDKILEAGASMAGGHSVEDAEPKYGLAVTGLVHPGRILTNCGARPGDALVLTKPLGTGVLFNALKAGRLPPGEMEPLLPTVAALNAAALETALAFEVHACTDVTGFGIAGHALEMARGSGLEIALFYKNIPLYPNALDMYRKGLGARSNRENRKYLEGALAIEATLGREEEEMLFDPQTSGGLLIAVPGPRAEELVRALRARGIETASLVGEVRESAIPGIRVV